MITQLSVNDTDSTSSSLYRHRIGKTKFHLHEKSFIASEVGTAAAGYPKGQISRISITVTYCNRLVKDLGTSATKFKIVCLVHY